MGSPAKAARGLQDGGGSLYAAAPVVAEINELIGYKVKRYWPEVSDVLLDRQIDFMVGWRASFSKLPKSAALFTHLITAAVGSE